MKNTFSIIALGLASVLSFSAGAAQQVSNEQVIQQNMQPTGTISVSGINGVPTEIRQQLSEKADNEGASAYRIIEAHLDGSYHATAELYK